MSPEVIGAIAVVSALVFVGVFVHYFVKDLVNTSKSSGETEAKASIAKEQAEQNEKDNIVRGRVRTDPTLAELVRTRRTKNKPK